MTVNLHLVNVLILELLQRQFYEAYLIKQLLHYNAKGLQCSKLYTLQTHKSKHLLYYIFGQEMTTSSLLTHTILYLYVNTPILKIKLGIISL